jgi:serine/threonine protein kinase
MATPIRERQDLSTWGFEPGEEIVPGRTAERLLGGGNRFEAWLGIDDRLASQVVVKMLRPACVADSFARATLAAEAEALAAVPHPAIVRCFDVVPDGERPHLVLEAIEGPRLSTLIRRYGPLEHSQLIPLALELSSALHSMHMRGYVHLDVKPRNVIVSAPPTLIDLSIARSIDHAKLIRAEVGTAGYMAPEQRVPSGAIGPASDVWALGVTIWEAATGVRPADGDPLTRERVPPVLRDVVASCLARLPSERPAAREIIDALEQLVALLPRKPVLSRFRPR